MRKVLYFALTVWILLWAQVVSNHFLGGTLFSIQWIFLAVLHFGLARGPWTGESMGFVWGLLLDASTLGFLGLHSMLFSLAGYAAGMFRRQLDASKLWTQTILSWMASLAYFTAYFLVTRLLSSSEESLRWAFLTVPLLNALAAPLVFYVLDFWAQVWDQDSAERKI